MKNQGPGGVHEAMFREMNAGEVFERALGHGREYASSVRERRVDPGDEELKGLTAFDRPLPDGPGNACETLDLLHTAGSPATVAQTGGRFFGLVNGGVVPAALGARLLADFWDQNAVLHATSPINSKLEEVVEGWLRGLFGLPEEAVAGYVGGTSIATACGLAAARYRLLERAGWDVNRKGLHGAPPLRIVTGRHTHGTVIKMLALLGFGTEGIEWVDVDEQGRVVPEAMPELDDRTIVVLQAGNVDSGSFDPIRAICENAKRAGAWVHVDGAFGLWVAACDQLRHLTDGIELANSWSVDAHKTLNVPYDNGVVLCADREALVGALQNSGAYIVRTGGRDGLLFTPDMSRRARAVDLWAALHYLGRSGVDDMVGTLHLRARQFERELRDAEFEVLNDVVFNQVLVAGETDALTEELIKRIRASGEAWVGGSSWFGRAVIRVSVCSWATTEEDVTRSVQAFVAARTACQG